MRPHVADAAAVALGPGPLAGVRRVRRPGPGAPAAAPRRGDEGWPVTAGARAEPRLTGEADPMAVWNHSQLMLARSWRSSLTR